MTFDTYLRFTKEVKKFKWTEEAEKPLKTSKNF